VCAICGLINFDGKRLEPSAIVAMTDSMTHRGPDDDGYFIDRNVALGHRRLSIIDLEGGQQPILNEDGSQVIVFNGEIYNYRELTARLRAEGHRFETRSDTEAILHAYEQYGVDCLEHLRGMFAFAIWDRRKQRLFMARDRLGIKPLYYYRGRGFLAFASEIKALLTLPEVRAAVDPAALDLYLSLRYVPGPRTMFRDIFKLQPGHFLLHDGTEMHVRWYWDIDHEGAERLPAAACRERFETLFHDAVEDRLISEVPLGVMLSGGLDSSAVLAEMTEQAGGRVKTFSVGYEADSAAADEANELHWARRVADHFGADHHEFRLRAADFGDFLDRLVWHLDEPLADPTCIPLYFISKLAREHVTVVLSGEGADETLAGYGIYPRMLALERLYRGLPGFLRSLGPAAAEWLDDPRARWYLQGLERPLEHRYRGVARGFLPELKAELLGLAAPERAEERLDSLLADYWERSRGASPLDRMLYLDTKVWLPDDLLLKADRMTMANGMELRVPFLDHRLVELSAQVPTSLKTSWGESKRLLRQTVGKRLPPFVLERAKMGFPVPTEPWLRSHLEALIHERLLADDSACSRYMDPAVITRIAAEHQRHERDNSQELWTLLVFEAWHRVFVDAPSVTASEHAPIRVDPGMIPRLQP